MKKPNIVTVTIILVISIIAILAASFISEDIADGMSIGLTIVLLGGFAYALVKYITQVFKKK